MVGVIRTCAGCKGDIDMSVEKAQPQKNGEWYHYECNKKYPVWIEARQPVFDEVDKIKDQKLEAVRKSIFGDRSAAKLTVEEIDAIKAKIAQDQAALNKAKEKAGA